MKSIDKDIAISDLLYKSFYGRLSEDEQTMLDCWLKDGENRRLYEELLQPEELYKDVLEMANLDTGEYYRKLQRHMNHKRHLHFWLTVTSLAAMFILLVGITGIFRADKTATTEMPFFIVQQEAADQTTLKTNEGEVYVLGDSIKQVKMKEIKSSSSLALVPQYMNTDDKMEYNLLTTSSRGNIEVTLADSTRVWLNAGSQLRYPNRFTAGKREVELVGEAYFEVARNEHRPFIVKTETTRIEVLGTQFNVQAKTGSSCVTTLVKGCVKVRNKLNDTVVIYPGQQVNASPDNTMVVKSVDPRYYTAWKRNRFAFQNEPLYQIMEQLAEWYNCTYRFSHPRLANLHFTTILPRYKDISQVLEVLQATREFGFVKTEQCIYITDHGHVN